MSQPNPAAPDEATIARTLQAYREAKAAGRSAESEQLLVRVAERAPGHPAVLNELGLVMMSRSEYEKAHSLFSRAAQTDPGHAQLWSNLASSLRMLGLRSEEREALERALSIEPRHLASLLQKASLLEDLGDARNAARAYQHALLSLPPDAVAPPTLQELLKHAKEAVAADQAALNAAIEEKLAGIRAQHGGKTQSRVDKCLELLSGRRSAYFPRPTFMYFPEIPALEFFERDAFPWLDAVEAATDDIRTELINVLIADRPGLQPYIDYPAGAPIDQWKELNHSRRWSAYFLWNQGTPEPAHIARCPRTMAVARARPALRSRGPGTDGIFFDPRSEDENSAAYGRHQYPDNGAFTADRSAGLQLSRRRHHARVRSWKSLAVRRHHRA